MSLTSRTKLDLEQNDAIWGRWKDADGEQYESNLQKIAAIDSALEEKQDARKALLKKRVDVDKLLVEEERSIGNLKQQKRQLERENRNYDGNVGSISPGTEVRSIEEPTRPKSTGLRQKKEDSRIHSKENKMNAGTPFSTPSTPKVYTLKSSPSDLQDGALPIDCEDELVQQNEEYKQRMEELSEENEELREQNKKLVESLMAYLLLNQSPEAVRNTPCEKTLGPLCAEAGRKRVQGEYVKARQSSPFKSLAECVYPPEILTAWDDDVFYGAQEKRVGQASPTL